jgi:group I intron endonuclease
MTGQIQFVNPGNWTSGIYKICASDGSFIIGSTNNFAKRCDRHFNLLRRNKHPNQRVQSKYNKYPDNWAFEAFEEVTDLDKLLTIEDCHIKKHYGTAKCMNLNIDATKPPSSLGTAEFKLKMRVSRLGKTLSEETRAKISKANKGKIRSEKQLENMRRVRMGRVYYPKTEVTKAKMRAAKIGKPWSIARRLAQRGPTGASSSFGRKSLG